MILLWFLLLFVGLFLLYLNGVRLKLKKDLNENWYIKNKYLELDRGQYLELFKVYLFIGRPYRITTMSGILDLVYKGLGTKELWVRIRKDYSLDVFEFDLDSTYIYGRKLMDTYIPKSWIYLWKRCRLVRISR